MKNKVFIVIASVAALLVVLTCVALVAPENKRDEGANNGAYVVDDAGEHWYESDGALSKNTAKTKAILPASSTQGIGRGAMEQKATDMAATAEYAGSAPSPVPTASIPGNTAKPIGIKQMMKKDGNVSLKADKPQEAANAIISIATKFGGDVLSMQSSGEKTSQYFNITIRVPSQKFDNAMQEVLKLGDKASVTTSSEDVTGEYIDMKSRLDSRTRKREALLTMLTKADKIGDLLSIHDRIADVEQEIESIKGQMQYLEGMTSYSRITVDISPKDGLISTDSPSGFVDGLGKIWVAFQKAILWLLMIIAVLIPFGIITLLVYFIVKASRKRPGAQS
ncbi:MAG TPA: DUF4349 domain-containing protein [Caldisericia bacterium]|nr:DUF4349 domain-containing protein [Caldisericia bacterium]HOR46805.1 DUF4349 domain-containing protein [Caldisericia bacterium]HOU07742.1 DUF4349 domain-containing protein [Caldisericia bacterium]HPL90161.1 DUF4349 domain-containing protein [Caldisericia bacterium]HQG59553.1 DUF4349 domain-containing protein [Caldisericia bacterium]